MYPLMLGRLNQSDFLDFPPVATAGRHNRSRRLSLAPAAFGQVHPWLESSTRVLRAAATWELTVGSIL